MGLGLGLALGVGVGVEAARRTAAVRRHVDGVGAVDLEPYRGTRRPVGEDLARIKGRVRLGVRVRVRCRGRGRGRGQGRSKGRG